MNCENVRDLLALSAAGLLEAGDERLVSEHARLCESCAAELGAFAALTGALSRQIAPAPSAALVYRTQLSMAAEADRREGARLATGAGVLAFLLALAAWHAIRLFGGSTAVGLWLVWSTAVAGIGSIAVAALVRRRHPERSW